MTALDLNTLTLTHGPHALRRDGVCLAEAVAWWAGEPHSDHPACADTTLGAFARVWNDGMRSQQERNMLLPFVPALAFTAGTAADADRRGWMACDWLVRVATPQWLDLAGLDGHATALRALDPITDDASLTTATPHVDAAQDAAQTAAWAAAWPAAWDAAQAAARDAAQAAAQAAARDAAWPAARTAAQAAARPAARAAAQDAARAAARDAAWAAAWDAVQAAAQAAAQAALEPTVTVLQHSAAVLLCDMIAAGPHDPAVLATCRQTVGAA